MTPVRRPRAPTGAARRSAATARSEPARRSPEAIRPRSDAASRRPRPSVEGQRPTGDRLPTRRGPEADAPAVRSRRSAGEGATSARAGGRSRRGEDTSGRTESRSRRRPDLSAQAGGRSRRTRTQDGPAGRSGRGAAERQAAGRARPEKGGRGAAGRARPEEGERGAVSRSRRGDATRRSGGSSKRAGSARTARDPGREPANARATGDGPDGDGGASVRLNKALSGAGLGSRRAVEELVRAGRVSVDGEVVHDLGRRVDPSGDRVEVDGSRVVLDERRRYWMLNKPAGVVSTAADPAGRPTVVGMVPEQPRVFPVGRLDRDTEGLLLLTNDGPLAYRLTHARYGIEKRYLAEVERLPADAPGRLRRGVELEDGFAKPARVRVVAGSGRRRMVEVVLVEGRNREVRRLLDAVGAPVRRLVRTAVGPIRLTGLAPGEFRPLRPEEIRSLYKAAGL
ncbi:MAG: pseudouridine synthase [Actinomycetes bacterium]